MDSPQTPESFLSLLLRDRGRTGLVQRELAGRAGVSRRSVQDWETGLTLPTAERLRALICALLEAGGLTAGREMSEARELWAAVEREGSRRHVPFDGEWFAGLLASRESLRSTGDAQDNARAAEPLTGTPQRARDWGEAPDAAGFVGRVEELALLQTWLLDERCRLVAVLGFGGIGKTALAAKLAQDVAPNFERVHWRSLRNAPPTGEWLAGAIGFLSDQQLLPPAAEAAQLTALLQLLRARWCLVVLDNCETLFEPGQGEGRYRPGAGGYSRLFRAIGESTHQSCLLLTSREAPPELEVLGRGVRAVELHGLRSIDAQALLADKQLIADSQAWLSLVDHYAGNGLALKIVGETIRQVYDGDVSSFLKEAVASYGTVFGGVRRLLDAQAERLSPIEQDVLTRMALEREPIKLAELSAKVAPGVARSSVIEAIETLRRRSLVERAEGGATFKLQSMVLEYITDRLMETAADEIRRGEPVTLSEQPLIQAQAKDYVRRTQERLIGEPILQQLERGGGERQLLALLEGWRPRPHAEQGYGPGNVVNLLRLRRGGLRGLDLSHLSIRQAYLQEVEAQDASLAHVHLAEGVLAGAFNHPISVALTGDGAFPATGTSGGEVCLWRVGDRTSLLAVQGHTGLTLVALSGDGRLLAGAGEDATVKLWEASSGRLVATLQGHTGPVRGVALSWDGRLLASGSSDGAIKLWEAASGRLLATMQGHIAPVRGVALSRDGRLLASGSTDGAVKLWEAASGQLLATMQGHTSAVWGVAMSGDGQIVDRRRSAERPRQRPAQVDDHHPATQARRHPGRSRLLESARYRPHPAARSNPTPCRRGFWR